MFSFFQSKQPEDECPICYNPVFLPTCFLGYDENDIEQKLRPCPFTKKNPVCLHCARKHLTNVVGTLRCIAGCCKINPNLPLWKQYGEYYRDAKDVAHPEWYASMDQDGIKYTTVCRLCKKDYKTMTDLGLHYKVCDKNSYSCNLCKNKVSNDKQKKHEKKCFRSCKYCNCILSNTSTTVEGTITYFEKYTGNPHSCDKKTLKYVNGIFCQRCDKPLYVGSIKNGEHDMCTLIRKGETVINR